jgi:hypothetical protein
MFMWKIGLNCKTFFYYIVKIILYKKYIFTGIREINNDLPIDGIRKKR